MIIKLTANRLGEQQFIYVNVHHIVSFGLVPDKHPKRRDGKSWIELTTDSGQDAALFVHETPGEILTAITNAMH